MIIISAKDELVAYISPEDFMEHCEQMENLTLEIERIAKNIKLDDNSIVIIAKLKKQPTQYFTLILKQI